MPGLLPSNSPYMLGRVKRNQLNTGPSTGNLPQLPTRMPPEEPLGGITPQLPVRLPPQELPNGGLMQQLGVNSAEVNPLGLNAQSQMNQLNTGPSVPLVPQVSGTGLSQDEYLRRRNLY